MGKLAKSRASYKGRDLRSREQIDVSEMLGPLLMNRLDRPATPFPGGAEARFAPLLPGLQRQKEMLQGTDPFKFTEDRDAAVKDILAGVPAYKLDPASTAKLFNVGVAAPSLRAFKRDIVPMIQDEAIKNRSLFSSGTDRNIAGGLSNLNADLMSKLAVTQMENERMNAQMAESAQERRMQMTQLADPFARSAALQQLLSPFQDMDQSKRNFKYEEFLRGQVENSPFLQAALSFALQGTQQIVQKSATASPLTAFGQAVKGIAGAQAIVASDTKLKENIELVGISDLGTNIYEFDYKDKSYGDGRYRGVIAQEVPEASIENSDGYLSVDYSKLDVDFERIQ
jgi:hypothetical protein